MDRTNNSPTMIDSRHERAWIQRFGRSLRKAIKSSRDIPELQTSTWLDFSDAESSDGWSFGIATLKIRGVSCHVYAMLDRFSGHPKRQPWIGTFLPSKQAAISAYEHLQRHGLKPILLPAAKMTVVSDHTRIARPLPLDAFGRPIVELYDGEPEKGVGMYLSAPRSFKSPPSQRSTGLAPRLLREMVAAMGHGPTRPHRHPHPKKRVLLRAAIVTNRSVRRDSLQASQAKQRDNFTCRICDLKPEQLYGIEGRFCLEAHHLDALAGKDRALSRLDRIVTLCANCHRILHRLPEEQRRLGELRRRVTVSSR